MVPLMTRGLQEPDPYVQEAACTCLALSVQYFYMYESQEPDNFTQSILQTMCAVVPSYKGAALTSLYDCLSMLSQSKEFKRHYK